MMQPALARQFVDRLADLLAQAPCPDTGGETFAAAVASEMRGAVLSVNTTPAQSRNRYPDWEGLTTLAASQTSVELITLLRELEPLLPWIEGSHFWPAQEHRYFAEKMWGALVIGEAGAAFYAEERYIMMLHTMAPQCVYPLHEHRIPEGYFIIGGHVDWSRDGEHWEPRPPGSLFYNKSWAPHSIRTHNEPLLSLDVYLPPFGWEGGLTKE